MRKLDIMQINSHALNSWSVAKQSSLYKRCFENSFTSDMMTASLLFALPFMSYHTNLSGHCTQYTSYIFLYKHTFHNLKQFPVIMLLVHATKILVPLCKNRNTNTISLKLQHWYHVVQTEILVPGHRNCITAIKQSKLQYFYYALLNVILLLLHATAILVPLSKNYKNNTSS
jgi:hypothetical protein